MQKMGEHLKNRLNVLKEPPPQKRGGLTSYSSYLRAKTAELLGEPFKKVAGLTRGFSNLQLERMLKASQEWVNPPALWWKLYKTEKQQAKQYAGQSKVRRVRAVGEKRRREDKEDTAQGVLFSDWQKRR